MAQDSPLRPRILRRLAGNQALDELRARGADIAALRHIAPRFDWLALIVPGLPMSQAMSLRKTAQEAGLPALLCRSFVRVRGQETSDIVIAGSAAALQTFAQGLDNQELAAGLATALDRLPPSPKKEWRVGARALALGEKTLVMGILNATPDSFSGDGFDGSVAEGLRRARQMVADGADILDVGGESSRPGADPVSADEELRRVVPLIEKIAAEVDIPISVDTTKARVAQAALQAGACIVNDISALRFDAEMAPTVAQTQAGLVLMHMLGTPRDMQTDPRYTDLMAEICAFLTDRAAAAQSAGIAPAQIALDPGFGFGKTVENNLEILRRLEEFAALGYPVLIGTSRKSTIGKVLETEPEDRLEGTAATVALAIAAGADIVRVHDVKEMARAARMADAVLRVQFPEPTEDEYVPWGSEKKT